MKPVVNEIVDDKALIKKLQKELKDTKDAMKRLALQQGEGVKAMSETEASNVAVAVESAGSPTSQGGSPVLSTRTVGSSADCTPTGATSGTGICTMETREQRLETPEKRQRTPNTSRVEPSPLASPNLTPERVSSPNNLSVENLHYDFAQLDPVLLENRLRSGYQDSKAERSEQQDCSDTISDLSSRRPPTVLIFQDSPPSEVTIIRSPLSDMAGEDVDITVRLNDAEERARFLEEKLEAADRLVELMTRDLRNARLCIHELVFRNVRLENQLAGTSVPSTVDVTESRTGTEEEGHAMMSSERIGI
jgi:hypothetical protein